MSSTKLYIDVMAAIERDGAEGFKSKLPRLEEALLRGETLAFTLCMDDVIKSGTPAMLEAALGIGYFKRDTFEAQDVYVKTVERCLSKAVESANPEMVEALVKHADLIESDPLMQDMTDPAQWDIHTHALNDLFRVVGDKNPSGAFNERAVRVAATLVKHGADIEQLRIVHGASIGDDVLRQGRVNNFVKALTV